MGAVVHGHPLDGCRAHHRRDHHPSMTPEHAVMIREARGGGLRRPRRGGRQGGRGVSEAVRRGGDSEPRVLLPGSPTSTKLPRGSKCWRRAPRSTWLVGRPEGRIWPAGGRPREGQGGLWSRVKELVAPPPPPPPPAAVGRPGVSSTTSSEPQGAPAETAAQPRSFFVFQLGDRSLSAGSTIMMMTTRMPSNLPRVSRCLSRVTTKSASPLTAVSRTALSSGPCLAASTCRLSWMTSDPLVSIARNLDTCLSVNE